MKPAPKLDQKSGEIAKLLGAERSSTQVTLEFSLVGLCHRIQPTFREGMSQINFTARTPIDVGRSRAIGWQARNYLLEPEYDAERMAGILQAVKEDLWVVESVEAPAHAAVTVRRVPDRDRRHGGRLPQARVQVGGGRATRSTRSASTSSASSTSS